MALPMQSGQFQRVVEPILNDVFDGVYSGHIQGQYKEFMAEVTGIPRSYHEDVVLYGMQAAPAMPEGTPVTYRGGGQLYAKRYTYNPYGLAFAITKVLVEDGEALNFGRVFARHMAQSLQETIEVRCANVLNRFNNASYVGGDNVALCSTSHPHAYGTWSNLETGAALSQTSLEQVVININNNAVDEAGKPIQLEIDKLIIPPSLIMQAERLMKSALTTGSANNDINPIVSKGWFGGRVAVVRRLSSTTAWFVKNRLTGLNPGLQLVWRRRPERSMEGDFETDSMRYKSTMRFDEGWTNPRDIWGNAGA